MTQSLEKDSMPTARRRSLWFFLIVILFFNCAIYAPAVDHPARADQIVYLLEVAPVHQLGDLLNHSVSFNRTRQLMAGDSFLYRPLLFGFLAIQKYFFGYDFRLWQLMGVLLHLILVTVLFRVLLQIRQHWLALVWTFHFSVLFVFIEMVIWHHINAYIIFTILFLLALLSYLRYRERHWQNHQELFKMVAYMTLANFVFEFGVICCGVFFAFLLFEQRSLPGRRLPARPFVLLLPVALFAGVDYLDWLSHAAGAGTGLVLVPHLPSFSWGFSIKDFVALFDLMLLLPFIPAFVTLQERERTFFTLADRWPRFNDPAVIANGLVLILLLVVLAWGMKVFWRNRGRIIDEVRGRPPAEFGGVWLTACLGFVLTVFYVLLLMEGRAQVSDLAYIRYNMHHFYLPAVLLTVTSYCLLARGERLLTSGRRVFCALLVIMMLTNALLNAGKVYAYNARLRQDYLWWGRYIKSVGDFVAEHQGEPDFSFQWAYRYRGGYTVAIKIGGGDSERKMTGYIADLLFREFLRKDQPKYYLVYLGDGRLLSFRERPDLTLIPGIPAPPQRR